MTGGMCVSCVGMPGRDRFCCSSAVGLNGVIPFYLVKEHISGSTLTGHIVNSAKRVSAKNRTTEIMDFLASFCTGELYRGVSVPSVHIYVVL